MFWGVVAGVVAGKPLSHSMITSLRWYERVANTVGFGSEVRELGSDVFELLFSEAIADLTTP
jgi:hypothetical protein